MIDRTPATPVVEIEAGVVRRGVRCGLCHKCHYGDFSNIAVIACSHCRTAMVIPHGGENDA